jgi:hypothetical protein
MGKFSTTGDILPSPLVNNRSSIVPAYGDRACLDTLNRLPDTA